MTRLASLIFIVFASTSAWAETFYSGVDLLKTDLNIGGHKTNPTQTLYRLGFNINPQFALEYQQGQSKKTDELYRLEVDLEKTQAVFARLISRDYQGITMDVSLGYARSNLMVNGPVGSYNGLDQYEGFAWGIAAYDRLSSIKNAEFRVSYQSFYDDDALHIRGFSFGLTYHF